MATPTIFNSTVTSPGGTGTSITPTLSTHAVGDVLLIFVGNTGNVAWSTVAGWTLLNQTIVGTAANGVVGTWLWHRVVSGDSLPLTNPVLALGATVTRHATCRTIRGADQEGVFTLTAWEDRGFTSGTSNPVRPPTVVSNAPEKLFIHDYVSKSATNAPDPSGYTQDQEAISSGTVVVNSSRLNVSAQNTSLANQDASPTSGVRWVAGILSVPSPDYVYYRAGSQATTASGTSVTPTKPTGTTNSDLSGRKDVMIATVEGGGSTTLAAADSGLWTAIPAWSTTTSGGGSSVKKFWAYATASPNMQFTRTGTGEISACVTTYYNCHQTNPIGLASVAQVASSTTSTWSALLRAGTKFTVQATCVADGVPTFTSPSGWVERMDGLGITCAEQIFNAAGSSASAAFTLSSASPTLVGLTELIGVSSVTDLTTGLSGNAGTSAIGSLAQSRGVATSGNAATASLGSLSPSLSFTLAGNAATSAIGTLTVSVSGPVTLELTGVGATGAVGALTPSVGLAASGNSTSTSIGSMAVSITTGVSGNAGASALGTPVMARGVALTGFGPTGGVGTLTPSRTVGITGNAGTCSLGSLSPDRSLTVSGNTATSSIGTVTSSQAVSISLSGNQATVSVGTVVISRTVPLTGNPATGAVGEVTVASGDITFGIDGVLVTGAVGSVGPDRSLALAGNSAACSLGSLYILLAPTVNRATIGTEQRTAIAPNEDRRA